MTDHLWSACFKRTSLIPGEHSRTMRQPLTVVIANRFVATSFVLSCSRLAKGQVARHGATDRQIDLILHFASECHHIRYQNFLCLDHLLVHPLRYQLLR